MKNKEQKWLIISNSNSAKIFSFEGKNNNLKINFITKLEAELDSNHEKPGRAFESVGATRHAIEPHTDRREVEKQKFISKIYDFVKTQEKNNAFDHLVLVSSAKITAMIEEVFDDELQKKISKKIPKNIVDLSDHEIKEYLVDKL